jgi:large subunit ribosomal protein L3
MLDAILGKKLGMTQIFDEKGQAIPVTVVQAGPCKITQVRTKESNGYEAIQIGFDETSRLSKPLRGHQKEVVRSEEKGDLVKTIGLKFLREVKPTNPIGEYKVGDVFGPDIFKAGEVVDITGTSKGKGFAGVMKRHGFGGGSTTHGQSDRRRAPGSIGAGTTPGRVVKGMRMAGHMGQARVTMHNLKIVRIDNENNLILIRGGVPGADGGLLIIRKAVKPGK